MMIYLPLAEVSVNAFLLLGLGGIVGVLSGMFGVGGTVLRMTDDGIVFETVWELPPP